MPFPVTLKRHFSHQRLSFALKQAPRILKRHCFRGTINTGNQTLNVGGGFTQTGGTLQLTAINPTSGASFNILNIAGTATVGGTLEVNVAGLTPGQTFSFVLKANAITGSFANVVNDQTGDTFISESLNADHTTMTVMVSALVNFSGWEAIYSFSSPATATPESDGVPNLLKYLYDINPTTPISATDRAALPTVGTTATYLTLTYRQYDLETGITVNVQTSPDLQTWTTVAVATMPNPVILEAGVSIVQTGNDSTTGDPIIQARIPLTGTRQFIRLNVTQP